MCLSSFKPIISKVKSYLPSHHSIHTNSISNECCVQSNHSAPPPPTKHPLATLLCVLVLLSYVSKTSSVLLQKKTIKQTDKQTKCLLLISLCLNLDQATSLPFTFPLCILEELITPLLVQPCTSLHTIRAQFIVLLYMHIPHSQAFYLCYFCTDVSIIKGPLDSDCLVVQMCWCTWQREALSRFSDFNDLYFGLL